jgi:guanine deaminase
MLCGKVLMDRNCPDNLRDTAESGIRDSLRLIERWHGRGRLRYSLTPRFAPTSSPEQLRLAGELLREPAGPAPADPPRRNPAELDWVAALSRSAAATWTFTPTTASPARARCTPTASTS